MARNRPRVGARRDPADLTHPETIAVVMPVGPDRAEVARCRDTAASIVRWEPAVTTLVLVDDSPSERDLVGELGVGGIDTVRLAHPLRGRRAPQGDRLGAGVLAGLAWVVEYTAADIVMKIDTDALVIGPFACKLSSALSDPTIGLLGSFDTTCNGDPRAFGPWVAPVRAAARLSRRTLLSARARRARRLIREARAAGYVWGEHVLACALAMPRSAVDAIAAGGGLDDPLAFVGVHLGDDPMLGVLVRRAGFRLAGHVAEGETFGVVWRGLPDTPQMLVERGYSIIHSVKNDDRFTEDEIRRYFAAAREMPSSSRAHERD